MKIESSVYYHLMLTLIAVALALIWAGDCTDYGLIVFAGLFFDVVIYTVWLKRRTCWSVV